MRYPTDQAELLMSIAAVMIFAGFWPKFIHGFTTLFAPWLRVSLAVVPILLLVAALVLYWRKRS